MVAAATKQQYKFVPVFAVMAETGTKCLILTQVLDLVISLYWYSEGAVPPTVCFTEKVFIRRYGALAVPHTLEFFSLFGTVRTLRLLPSDRDS